MIHFACYVAAENHLSEKPDARAENAVFGTMHTLLALNLPRALVKREFDKQYRFTPIDRLLLDGTIPYCEEHPTWVNCVAIVTEYVRRIRTGVCRCCGKKRPKMTCCKSCKGVVYCNSACLMADLRDKSFGHVYLECEFIS